MDAKSMLLARGRLLEDFKTGDQYAHWPGRTITEADNIQFSLLTMNRHPTHCDHHYASQTEFGKPLVNSGLTLAIVLGMSVDDISANAVANLGWQEIELLAPVHPGDTVYARSEVLSVREQVPSRPGCGDRAHRRRARRRGRLHALCPQLPGSVAGLARRGAVVNLDFLKGVRVIESSAFIAAPWPA